jgi:hypothetical protein
VAVQDGQRAGSEGVCECLEIIGARHVFYARMDRSGRITVPRLTRELVRGLRDSRVGYGLNVMLEPA